MSSPSKPIHDAPERWSKSLTEGDPLRGALRAARDERAPSRRLDRVFASVVAMSPAGAGGGELAGSADVADVASGGAAAASGAHAIGNATVVGKVAVASVATTSGALAKALVVGVFGAASVGTAWWIGGDSAPIAPAPTVVKSAPARVTSAAPPPEERPREVAARPSASASSAPTPAAPANAPAMTDERSEATLLREASAALSSDPTHAMELLDEAERRFARGALGQERELLRVQALIAAGRRDEAVERARKLLERNPTSAHRPRLEKTLPELAN